LLKFLLIITVVVIAARSRIKKIEEYLVKKGETIERGIVCRRS